MAENAQLQRDVETLGHNPLHERDIQGHENEVPQHPCPAVYDAPDGDLDLCWGEITQGEAGTTYHR
jgi:hypothetical protein